MAITDKKTGPWGLDQVYNKINQGSIWTYSGVKQLWALGGNNDYGGLGQNNRTKYSSPVQITGTWAYGEGNVTISTGIKPDGTLWIWGRNNFGQIGDNTVVDKSSPVQVPGTTWSTVRTGYNNHIVATKTDGSLWAWGYNGYGELGHNNKTNYSSPVQVGSDTTWSKVFGEYTKSFGIKTDGTLWSWGYNGYGYLGLNERTQRSSPAQVPGTTWKKISGGVYHTTAVKTDGTIWAWGYNGIGSLGQNQTHNQNHRSSPTQIGSGTTWDSIASGGYQNLAVKTDGTMFGWGYNAYGQLGQNDIVSRSSPVQVPGTTWGDKIDMNNGNDAYAIKTDGTLWSWGEENNDGRMGHNTTAVSRSSPTQVGSDTTWEEVASGGQTGVLVIKGE